MYSAGQGNYYSAYNSCQTYYSGYWTQFSFNAVCNNQCNATQLASNAVFYGNGGAYTAGRYYDGTNYYADYAQGTNVYYLPTDYPGYNTYVNSLFVEGNTVYTAGYYNNGSTNVPCYWTGGVRTDFGDGAHSAVVNSMFVQ